MKIRPVGAELFHADGRTDMTNVVVAFRNFVNAPKNGIKNYVCSVLFIRDCSRRKYRLLGTVSFNFSTINSIFLKLFYISFYRPILELFR